jgi:hypothetical protein
VRDLAVAADDDQVALLASGRDVRIQPAVQTCQTINVKASFARIDLATANPLDRVSVTTRGSVPRLGGICWRFQAVRRLMAKRGRASGSLYE